MSLAQVVSWLLRQVHLNFTTDWTFILIAVSVSFACCFCFCCWTNKEFSLLPSPPLPPCCWETFPSSCRALRSFAESFFCFFLFMFECLSLTLWKEEGRTLIFSRIMASWNGEMPELGDPATWHGNIRNNSRWALLFKRPFKWKSTGYFVVCAVVIGLSFTTGGGGRRMGKEEEEEEESHCFKVVPARSNSLTG